MRALTAIVMAAISSSSCGGKMGGPPQAPKEYNGALGPGAIIEIYSKPEKIEFACTQTESIGAADVVDVAPGTIPTPPANATGAIIYRSREPDFTSNSSSEAQITLDATVARVVKQLQAKGEFNNIRKLDYAVTNVYRLTTSFATVRTAVMNGKRAPGCASAIDERGRLGFTENLVTQVFTGDVTYSLDFKEGVTADVKAEIVKDVAPSIGGSVKSEDFSKVTGTNVMWLAASIPYGDTSKLRTGN